MCERVGAKSKFCLQSDREYDKIDIYSLKCDEGDSDHQTPTGIQRHRLRALFGREDCGNTAGAGGLNRRQMSQVGSFVSARYAHEERKS